MPNGRLISFCIQCSARFRTVTTRLPHRRFTITLKLNAFKWMIRVPPSLNSTQIFDIGQGFFISRASCNIDEILLKFSKYNFSGLLSRRLSLENLLAIFTGDALNATSQDSKVRRASSRRVTKAELRWWAPGTTRNRHWIARKERAS